MAFIGLALSPALICRAAGRGNLAYLPLISNVAPELNFEACHPCSHVKDDRIVRHAPLSDTVRHHHIALRDQVIMIKGDFNVPNLSECRLVFQQIRLANLSTEISFPLP